MISRRVDTIEVRVAHDFWGVVRWDGGTKSAWNDCVLFLLAFEPKKTKKQSKRVRVFARERDKETR